MNLDKGAKTLEKLSNQGVINAPLKLKTFTLDDLPNFKELYGDQKITIALSRVLHGWMNASLYEEIVRVYGFLEGGDKDPFRKKTYGLEPENVGDFIEQAMVEFDDANFWGVSPMQVSGVSYVSWNPDLTDNSYIALVSEGELGKLFNVPITDGNPNGWDFNPNILSSGIEGNFKGSIEKSIVGQLKTIWDNVPFDFEGDSLIVEGRVVRDYVQEGPSLIATDLYEGYAPLHDISHLGHAVVEAGYVRFIENS